MDLKTRNHTTGEIQTPTYGSSGDDDAPASDSRNILVTHGVHHGNFPIGGMVVRDARRLLRGLINIDDEAVAVINGRPVEEDTVISEDISALSFVKPSAIRG